MLAIDQGTASDQGTAAGQSGTQMGTGQDDTLLPTIPLPSHTCYLSLLWLPCVRTADIDGCPTQMIKWTVQATNPIANQCINVPSMFVDRPM